MNRETISLEDFRAVLRGQGVPREHFAFECPSCKTVQSAHDLITAGAGGDFAEVEPYLGFSCLGRFNQGGETSDRSVDKGRGCNWTLGGLFQIHELEIDTGDGERYPRFRPVTPAAAQEHAQRNGWLRPDEAVSAGE